MKKNIYYMELYSNDIKEKNIGFIRFNTTIMYMLIILKMINISIREVCVTTTSGEQIIISGNNITMKQNTSNQLILECQMPVEQTLINEIIIPLSSTQKAKCFINSEEREKESKIKNIIPNYEIDKWNQLCKTYQKIHIYSQADIVIINPKDIVVLTRQFHELATNSFVLHAYYNYKQLLLIRYKNQKGYLYYLGVPGIYNEREKRIAMMFGFEKFENGEMRFQESDNRKVYEGCFGYYMKKVDI